MHPFDDSNQCLEIAPQGKNNFLPWLPWLFQLGLVAVHVYKRQRGEKSMFEGWTKLFGALNKKRRPQNDVAQLSEQVAAAITHRNAVMEEASKALTIQIEAAQATLHAQEKRMRALGIKPAKSSSLELTGTASTLFAAAQEEAALSRDEPISVSAFTQELDAFEVTTNRISEAFAKLFDASSTTTEEQKKAVLAAPKS